MFNSLYFCTASLFFASFAQITLLTKHNNYDSMQSLFLSKLRTIQNLLNYIHPEVTVMT
jgi:hypothetical protein